MKVKSMDVVKTIKEVAKEWEVRTRLDLEWEIFDSIHQKDVNNYIISTSTGKYKSKGAYIKKLSNIDYDLPIVNKALIDYFLKDIPLKDTIYNCNSLRDFQKIIKITSLYKYAYYNNEKIKEKVHRVFASTDEAASGIFKVKTEGKFEKVGNTPDKCFINNEDVKDLQVPTHLNKDYYVEMAEKRLNDFLSKKAKNKISNPSDIKFVSIENKTYIIDELEKYWESFHIFLLHILKDVDRRSIGILIKLNYFEKFGNSKFLFEYFTLFSEFWDTKTKSLYEKITKLKIEKNFLQYSELFTAYAVGDGKYYTNIGYENIFLGKLKKTSEFTLKEKVDFNVEYMNFITFKTDKEEDRPKILILELTGKNKMKLEGYSIGSGMITNYRIYAQTIEKYNVGDIFTIEKLKRIPKITKTEDGFTDHPTEKEWLIERIKENND